MNDYGDEHIERVSADLDRFLKNARADAFMDFLRDSVTVSEAILDDIERIGAFYEWRDR